MKAAIFLTRQNEILQWISNIARKKGQILFHWRAKKLLILSQVTINTKSPVANGPLMTVADQIRVHRTIFIRQIWSRYGFAQKIPFLDLDNRISFWIILHRRKIRKERSNLANEKWTGDRIYALAKFRKNVPNLSINFQ